MHEFMGNRANVVPALLINRNSNSRNQNQNQNQTASFASSSESDSDSSSEEEEQEDQAPVAKDRHITGQRVRQDKKKHKSSTTAGDLIDKVLARMDETREKQDKKEDERAKAELDVSNRIADIMTNIARSLQKVPANIGDKPE